MALSYRCVEDLVSSRGKGTEGYWMWGVQCLKYGNPKQNYKYFCFRYDINPRVGGTHKVLHVDYDKIAVIYSCSQVATMKYELGWILTRDPLASPTLVSKGYFKMWMHPKLRECISDCKRFVRVQDSRYRDWLPPVRGGAHSLLQLQPQGAALHRSATGGVVWMIDSVKREVILTTSN